MRKLIGSMVAAARFLVDDDLGQHLAGDVLAGLGVDHFELAAFAHHLRESVERDVSGAFGVIETPIGVLLDRHLAGDLAMDRSQTTTPTLLPQHSALQHERAPAPAAVVSRIATARCPEPTPSLRAMRLRACALTKPRRGATRPPTKPEIARVSGACLRDHGGDGPARRAYPLADQSAAHPRPRRRGVACRRGRRAWGGARCCSTGARRTRARARVVAGHVEELLLPLLRSIGEPAALVGYCLGGTMAIAAANLVTSERVATLAAPWNFARYPNASHAALRSMWHHAEPASRELGALPMEVLQASFWSLDPERTVRKFAEFGSLDPQSAEAQRFVELEDWANGGEPLPYPAAKELIEDLFERDLPGSGLWRIASRTMTDDLDVPLLNLTAARDRIAPAATAPAGDRIDIATGHVGMIVGSARERLHAALAKFLKT